MFKLDKALSLKERRVWFQASANDMKHLMEDPDLQDLKFKESNIKSNIIGHVAKLICVDWYGRS